MTIKQRGIYGGRVEFDGGAVAVTGSDFVLVGRIPANGRPVSLRGVVGAGGALADAKIALAAVSDGGATDWNPGDSFTPVKTTAAGGSFYLFLETGAADVLVYAKKASADTTVQLTGTILDRP